jgi:signal transduction histidine kinase
VEGPTHWLPIFTQSFGSAVVLSVHYLIVQIALAFYRQFLKLDKALKELDHSQKQLQKAYEAAKELSALEERQRIAKDIHDTAGHSITTVIMQTEAAKLIIEKSPQEAKQKIVSANLQAKHALEELRNSVHLLSGIAENQTLKSALENIIHETTDGTNIYIRSSIQELSLSPAKARFLCNTLKEGISNGLRHGNATAFWFELKEEEGKICFLLSDNGAGVQEKGVKLGFGLRTMRERVQALGGEIIFHSEAEEGFEIAIT